MLPQMYPSRCRREGEGVGMLAAAGDSLDGFPVLPARDDARKNCSLEHFLGALVGDFHMFLYMTGS